VYNCAYVRLSKSTHDELALRYNLIIYNYGIEKVVSTVSINLARALAFRTITMPRVLCLLHAAVGAGASEGGLDASNILKVGPI